MKSERASHTLQPTALVHEVYIRMLGQISEASDRAHFFAIAARTMRQVLVDQARMKLAAKRGGGQWAVELQEGTIAIEQKPAMLLHLNEALDRLEQISPRAAQVIDMQCFGGMTQEEIALALGLTPRTIKRDWDFGKKFLKKELKAA